MANIRRRVRRFASERDFINTVNVRDRVTIDFVWFPGAPIVANSHVNPVVANHPRTGSRRSLTYTWRLDGARPVRVPMTDCGITVSLPPNRRGVLTAFTTEWELTRVGRGVNMAAVNQVRGIQQRLNRLGYHLRAPGAERAGVDGVDGRRTERAVIAFQVDYTPPVGAAAPANNQLQVRGEWQSNPGISGTLTGYLAGSANPSAADAAAFQAALRARVGA